MTHLSNLWGRQCAARYLWSKDNVYGAAEKHCSLSAAGWVNSVLRLSANCCCTETSARNVTASLYLLTAAFTWSHYNIWFYGDMWLVVYVLTIAAVFAICMQSIPVCGLRRWNNFVNAVNLHLCNCCLTFVMQFENLSFTIFAWCDFVSVWDGDFFISQFVWCRYFVEPFWFIFIAFGT